MAAVNDPSFRWEFTYIRIDRWWFRSIWKETRQWYTSFDGWCRGIPHFDERLMMFKRSKRCTLACFSGVESLSYPMPGGKVHHNPARLVGAITWGCVIITNVSPEWVHLPVCLSLYLPALLGVVVEKESLCVAPRLQSPKDMVPYGA